MSGNPEPKSAKEENKKELDNVAIIPDEITLTPDMSKTWGRVLKSLREDNESVLYAAVTELDDIEFTTNEIIVNVRDQGVYALLMKYKELLNKYANGAITINNKPKEAVKNTNIIEKLKKLFDDKIKIE